MTNKFKNQVSAQFIHDTIPPSVDRDCDCAKYQMLQVENQRLKWLIANMMQNVENIEEFNDDK